MLTSGLVIVQLFAQSSDHDLWEIIGGRPFELETEIRIIVRELPPLLMSNEYRRGLFDEPRKPPGGYRHYPADMAKRVRFIKRAQALGFTLEEIASSCTLRRRIAAPTRGRWPRIRSP